jgi:hypothetical protein
LLLAGSLLASAPAQADTFFLRTGVDALLNVLGENAVDPFWNISVQGQPATDAEVVNAEVICCGMETVNALETLAAWISDPSVTKPSPGTGWGINQTAVATRTFDLTGFDIDTVQMNGAWRVADRRLGLFINGTLLEGSDDGEDAWFSDELIFAAGPQFFIPGLNTIELRGNSVNSQFDGFWFSAVVDGEREDVTPSPVPEPGTVSMIGLGVAGLIAHLRRRRSARS